MSGERLLVKNLFEKFVSVRTSWRRKGDFKSISALHFREFEGGRQILEEGGFIKFLEGVYPFQWNSFRFARNNWNSGIEERFFLEFFSVNFPGGVRTQVDWKVVDVELFKKFEGHTLLHKHGSLLEILSANFPEFFWERVISKLYMVLGYKEKRLYIDRFLLNYLHNVRTQINLVQLDRQYLLRYPGGSTLLCSAGGSPQKVFQDLYPELFPKQGKRAQRGYWKNLNSYHWIMKAMQDFSIREKYDWYRLSMEQFAQVYGKLVPKKKMVKLLEVLQPEEDWDYLKFSERVNKRSRQKYLGMKLVECFENEVMFEDHVFSFEGRTVIFDFYLPERNLVIEYQGEQHFFNIGNWKLFEEQKKRDEEKRTICSIQQIRLVNVPYWWDGTLDSLENIMQN